MSTLFDISPDEPVRRSSARARKKDAPPPAEKQEAKKAPFIYRQSPIKALGRLDHTHECADTRCRGSAHDIIHEHRGEWLIQCCYCHTCQWVPVIKDHLAPKAEAFSFRDGRFAGLTIDEAAEQPHGLEYLAWAAGEHKRDAVRKACQTWLDARQSAL